MTQALQLLDYVQGRAVVGDAGYDSGQLVAAARARGIKAVIASNPTRKRKRPKDRALYRLRYRIECFFHSLKRFRAIATRYEKSARSYLALIHLACSLLWLN
jgi:transposase